jgi:hypothetical protein
MSYRDQSNAKEEEDTQHNLLTKNIFAYNHLVLRKAKMCCKNSHGLKKNTRL